MPINFNPIWFDSPRPMSLGMMLPIREGTMGGVTPRFDDLVDMTSLARDVGFEVAWFGDHLTMGDGDNMHGAWEAWTMMAAVAACVPGIQIGPLVTCAGFRNPGLIAKSIESLDEISGGRAILGIGAGWNEPEYRQFGYPFDHRASRFEDAINIIRPLLRDGEATWDGAHARADGAINQPRGPRPSGAPILIGSNGPRMLGNVARFADAWNSDWVSDPAALRPLLANVDAACDAIGRPRASLIRTGSKRYNATDLVDVRAVAADLVAFRDLGLKHMVVGLEPRVMSSVDLFGEVISALDTMPTAR